MKNYEKNKESSYLKYWYVNSLYEWEISQKLHANDFKWVEEISQFNEGFIKINNEDSGIGYFIDVYVKYLEKLHKLHNDSTFLPEKMKK